MRNSLLALAAASVIGFGLSVTAAETVTTVTLKETPVEITKDGDVYVVPAGSTATYYYYTVGDARQVCTTAEPAELAGVKFLTLNVRLGGDMTTVRCYPSTYFVTP